jgi:hypothetical protein
VVPFFSQTHLPHNLRKYFSAFEGKNQTHNWKLSYMSWVKNMAKKLQETRKDFGIM